MEILIRDALPADAGPIAELLGQLGYPATAEQIPQRLGRMRAEPDQHVLVADVAGEVVGVATVIVRHVINADEPFGRLASVVVAEGWRGKGIGGALIAEAERICAAAGCALIEVTSGAHRPRAHDFYRRLGYAAKPERFIKRL